MKTRIIYILVLSLLYNISIAQQNSIFEDSIIAYSKCNINTCEKIGKYLDRCLDFDKDGENCLGNYPDSLDDVLFKYDTIPNHPILQTCVRAYIEKYQYTNNPITKQKMLNKCVDVLTNIKCFDSGDKGRILFPIIISQTARQLGKRNVESIKSFLHYVALHGYRDADDISSTLIPICYWAIVNNLKECRKDIEEIYHIHRSIESDEYGGWKKKRIDVIYGSFLARLKDNNAANQLYNQLHNDKDKVLGYKYLYIILSQNLQLSKIIVEDLYNNKDYFVIHPEEPDMKEVRQYIKEIAAIYLYRIIDFKDEEMGTNEIDYYGRKLGDVDKMKKWFKENPNYKLKMQVETPILKELKDFF